MSPRTIAYYVQEGLLPKVGCRGPRTRYPKLFLDRLLFIRRVRTAEEKGAVSPVTLGDLRRVFARIPPALIAAVAEGRMAVTDELVSAPPTTLRMPGGVRQSRWDEPESREEERESRHFEPKPDVARRRPRLFAAEHHDLLARLEMPAPADLEIDAVLEEPAEQVEDAGEAGVAHSPRPRVLDPAERPSRTVAELLAILDSVARRRVRESGSAVESWARIRVSSHIAISVRGLDDGDAALVAMARAVLREAIG